MHEPDLSRYHDVLALVRDHARATDSVRVAIVGGAAATGRFDAHSDLDLELWADGPPDATYAGLRDLLLDRLDVDHVWERLPDTWPDGSRQCFVHLQPDAGDLGRPTLLLDVAVHPGPDDGVVRIDPARHGRPHVLHDPAGLLRLEPEDGADHARRREALRSDIAARRQTAEWLVRRALARGDRVEATAFYLRFGLTPLVELLRMVHSPARHDFGLRYLQADLPAPVVRRVEELLPGPDLGTLASDVFAWQDQLLAGDATRVEP